MKNTFTTLVVGAGTLFLSMFIADSSRGANKPDNSLERKIKTLPPEQRELAQRFLDNNRVIVNQTIVYNDTKPNK